MPESSLDSDSVTQQFELCIRSDLGNLEKLSGFVASVATELSLDEAVTFALQMAVDEACANVMEHAYAGGVGALNVAIRADGGDVVVVIHDHGHPFDPDAVPRPDPTAPLEKRGEGALGLYLMEQLMDSVVFHFDPVTGNTLTMRKRLRGADQTIPRKR